MTEAIDTAQDILETVDKLHQEEIEQIKLEIENAFSREQSKIITDLFTNTYRLTVLQHENSFSCIYANSILSAFYELLVEKSDVISKTEFEACVDKHLNDNLKKLNESVEKAAKPE